MACAPCASTTECSVATGVAVTAAITTFAFRIDLFVRYSANPVDATFVHHVRLDVVLAFVTARTAAAGARFCGRALT